MCPFIDRADARCTERLNFRNLAHAFRRCADRYAGCPTYQRFIAEGRHRDKAENTSRFLAAS